MLFLLILAGLAAQTNPSALSEMKVGDCVPRQTALAMAGEQGVSIKADLVGLLPSGVYWSDRVKDHVPQVGNPVAEWTLEKTKTELWSYLNSANFEKRAAEYARGTGISIEQARKDQNDTRAFLTAALEASGATLARRFIFTQATRSYEILSEDFPTRGDVKRYCLVAIKASR